MKRLLGDDARSTAIRLAIEARAVASSPLDDAQKQALAYAEKLTMRAQEIEEGEVQALRTAGFDDGEILEINQVCAYFNYANRTVFRRGCSTRDDIIGLSPNDSDNSDDWSHS